MGFREHFYNELHNPNTKYFILDSKGTGEYGDIDFEKYGWDRSRYNKVKEGDVFLYRRPRSASETNKFYFFGAGKIQSITDLGTKTKRVSADLVKSYPFQEYLHQGESVLEEYEWKFKKRENTWEHFFNQYGMSQISQEDFEGILEINDKTLDEDNIFDLEEAKTTIQNIQKKDYFAADDLTLVKTRTKHTVISNEVKVNYKHQCAICKLSTLTFLVGSHIIPWSVRKDIRLDPSNVICLCSIHDKAFDTGYISISDDYKVIASKEVFNDPVLKQWVEPYIGKKLHLPSIDFHKPNKEYLKYHRNKVFEKLLRKMEIK